MKTRQEMIYEFMVALSSNPKACDLMSSATYEEDKEISESISQMACALADKFLEKAL
jgi:hypothetical protein